MIIAFYAKDKELSKDIMDSIKAVLENDGHSVIYLDALDSVEKIDRVVAFGGDGTMLKTAVYAVKRSIPVIGVNLGNTGFLAYMNVTDDPTTIAEAILSSHYETRTLICVEYKGITHMALNDIFIGKTSSSPIYTTLYVDGDAVDRYHSDGIIVATPTGSTAYSLSAGGPVLAPDVDAIIINPVCPHSLHSRPIIVSPKSEICLKDKEFNVSIMVDGETIGETTDEIIIKKYPKDVCFIKPQNASFYNRLLNKMNKWGITPTEEVVWQEQRDN